MFCLPKIGKYLKVKKTEFQNLFWAVIIAFAAALFGAYAGIQYQIQQEQKEQRTILKGKLDALSFEMRSNLDLIEELRNTLTQQGVDVRELRTDAANQIISDFLTYNDGSRELFEDVSRMVGAIDEVNNLTDLVMDHFEEPRQRFPKTVGAVENALNRAKNSIQEVQQLLDKLEGSKTEAPK